MFFSKKGAKVLALTSAFAFALAGLSYSPAKVQAAADKAPTVKVLGATLRLDGDSGKQSLRFGIEVSNASNAEACGIEITYGTKTITVATDVNNTSTSKKHTDIYSKDDENDTIVYSAVVKGIPKKNYGNMFDIKGYVKQSIDVEKELSDSVPRSVDKVVKSMQEINPNIKLDAKGDLVKVVSVVDGKETTEPVTAGDFSQVDKMEVSKGIVDLSKEGVVVGDGCTPTYNEATKAIDALVGMHTGIIVKSPLDTDDYRMYKKVKLTYTTSSSNFDFYIFDGQMGNEGKGREPAGSVNKGKLVAAGEPKTVEFYAAKALYGIKLVNMGGEADFHINSVEFCEEVAPDVVEVDLSKPSSVADGIEIVNNDDKSITINWTEKAGDYAGVSFDFERGLDLTGYTCHIDAVGDNMNFTMQDKQVLTKTAWGTAKINLREQYGVIFPCHFPLNDANLTKKFWDQKPNLSIEGKEPDFHNVGSLSFGKGNDKSPYSLTIKSIRFCKNVEKPDVERYDLDITNFKENNNMSVVYNDDKSVTLSWKENAGNWSGIELPIEPVDLNGYSKMVVSTKGGEGESIFCVNLKSGSEVVGTTYGFGTNKQNDLSWVNNRDIITSIYMNKNNDSKPEPITITGISFIKDTP